MNNFSILLLTCLWLHSAAFGQVGYFNTEFVAGGTLFKNPFEALPNNNLSSVLSQGIPEGTTVSLWNPAANAFDVTSQYQGGAWTIDLALPLGTGALLNAPQTFTNIFLGEVRNRAGGPYNDGAELQPAPVFAAPPGTYLLGDKMPYASSGNDIFKYVLGRSPSPGEQIRRLQPGTLNYIMSTYLGNGNWDAMPSLRANEAAFFTIIPEPSAVGLGLLGGSLVWGLRRQR